MYLQDQYFTNVYQQTNRNYNRYYEEETKRVDLQKNYKLGTIRPDFKSDDDLYMKYQGYKYFPSYPVVKSIRPEIPYYQLVGVKSNYVEAINKQIIDVSGTMIPISQIKKMDRKQISGFD